MISFLKKNIKPMGLEIGYDTIRVVQFAPCERSPRLVAARKVSFDPSLGADPAGKKQFVISTLKELLDDGKFDGREVMSALPGDAVKIKSLRLEPDNQRPDEQTVINEIAQRFGLDPQADEIRYVVAGKVYHGNEIKNEVIFFSTEKSRIAEHIELLEQAGLTPVGLDAAPVALFRSFQNSLRRHEDRQRVALFVDIGSICTTVITGREKNITFVKQLPIGSRHFSESIASRLGIGFDEAAMLRSNSSHGDENTSIDPSTTQALMDVVSEVVEKLVREVSLCFQYHSVTFRGERPVEVVCSGGETSEQMLIDALNRNLGVEVKIAQPFRGFDLGRTSFVSSDKAELSEWAVAVGLGIKGWEPSDFGIQADEGS